MLSHFLYFRVTCQTPFPARYIYTFTILDSFQHPPPSHIHVHTCRHINTQAQTRKCSVNIHTHTYIFHFHSHALLFIYHSQYSLSMWRYNDVVIMVADSRSSDQNFNSRREIWRVLSWLHVYVCVLVFCICRSTLLLAKRCLCTCFPVS